MRNFLDPRDTHVHFWMNLYFGGSISRWSRLHEIKEKIINVDLEFNRSRAAVRFGSQLQISQKRDRGHVSW